MPPPRSGNPRVIQGSFLYGLPILPPRAVQLQPGAVPRPQQAAHVQAALERHSHNAPVAQRSPGAPAVAASPTRIGHAVALPPTIQLSPAGPGEPLPPALRQQMETLLRADFSAVRVHVGPQVTQLGARALTMGSEIYFAPGHYAPHTAHGRRLLAHELTHVVQQSAGRVRNPFGQGIAVVQDPGLEAEAERMSLRAALPDTPGAGTVIPHRHPAPAVQRAKRKWEVVEDVTVEGATGHTGSGFLPENTELTPRKKRKYKDSREEQVLGEISTLLYFALKHGDEPVTEVEGMWAGGSLFLACNTRMESEMLYDFFVLKSLKKQWELLTSSYGNSKTKIGKATNRMATKLEQLRSGKRDIEKAKKVIETLERNEVGEIDLLAKDKDYYASLALEVPGYTWVVTGQDKRHAEVKLVKVLEAAGYKSGATIQGKKRPCYSCAAYMRLRKKEGYKLVFSDFPGKLWQDEYNRSEKDVQEEVVRALKEGTLAHKTEYGEEWRSDSSSSEDEDAEWRPVLVKKRKKKTTKKKGKK